MVKSSKKDKNFDKFKLWLGKLILFSIKLGSISVSVIAAVLYFPYVIVWLYPRLPCFIREEIKLLDYFNYVGNTFTGALGIIISLLALWNSLKKESIEVEVSKDVMQRYITTSCRGFLENSKGKTFSYYKLKTETYGTHINRLAKNGILIGPNKELCDSINGYTQDLKNIQKTENKEKIKKIAQEARLMFWQEKQVLPNKKKYYELKTEVAQILDNLS